jgi:tetratricopeptide (TPR) repeat protein
MRRFGHLFVLAVCVLAGCSDDRPPTVVVVPAPTPAPAGQPAVPTAGVPTGAVAPVAFEATAPATVDRYDAALLDALARLADRRYADALASLEAARAIRDSEHVRGEIGKVKALLDLQVAADNTAVNIKAVLDDGKPAEAAALATAALGQFGGGEVANVLEQLKRQADATAAAAATFREDERRARCRAEADAALRDSNLRAAAAALEQIADDPDARRRLDEVRDTVARYDDARRRADRFRRDPSSLEQALAALQEARGAWDTPQVRTEIDECSFALRQRRDRLSVADFEVRGDASLGQAGRAVAEELLPAFKGRYDLVERGQIGRVLEELRFEDSTLGDDSPARRELARLARVRYLVVGSVSQFNGVTVQARLVDLNTGLVVQTARISAPDFPSLMPRLPQLAQVLMMDDARKLAFEQAQDQQAVAVTPIPVVAVLPPPPEYLPTLPPPPPVVTYAPGVPALGGLVVADFAALPAFGAAVVTPAAVVVTEEDPHRQRLLALSLELGDNLFRRGKHREARRHFELALSLTKDRADVQVRIDRCRPSPPPVVLQPAPPSAVVVTPQPPPVVLAVAPRRQRVIVFNFLVNADPGLVPPALGEWAADQLASYWAPRYDVVERGEVCWYMGRLGVTMRDVLADPAARQCLARALDVRLLVFGAIEQTHSFNVSAHVIDAETGARTGTGAIHVQDHGELKVRMQELVQQTGAAPAEQVRLARQGKESEQALNEARRLQKAGDAAGSARILRAALKEMPGNGTLQAMLTDSEEQAKRAAAEAEREQQEARRAREVEAARLRAAELAARAEAARVRAAEEAKKRDAAARQALEQEKQRAYERLREQGHAALAAGHYAEAVAALQSAAALHPGAEASQELARAKAAVEGAERARAAEEAKKRDAEEQRRREEARLRVQQEQERRKAAELADARARQDRDVAESRRLAGQARQALARQDFAAALAASESAARLHDDAEARALLDQVRREQEQYRLRKEAEAAAAETRRKQIEEAARRERAAADAARRQAEPVKPRGTPALPGPSTEMAREQRQPTSPVPQPKPDAARATPLEQAPPKSPNPPAGTPAPDQTALRRGAYERAMNAGRSAMATRNFAGAEKAYAEALGIVPNDPAAVQALRAARAALEPQQATAKPAAIPATVPASTPKVNAAAPVAAPPPAPKAPPAPATTRAEYSRAMQAGLTLEKEKKYAEAAAAYREALRSSPGDPKATASLRSAEFLQHLSEGQRLHAAKRYADAVREYEEALKRSPGDAEATRLLAKAKQGQLP